MSRERKIAVFGDDKPIKKPTKTKPSRAEVARTLQSVQEDTGFIKSHKPEDFHNVKKIDGRKLRSKGRNTQLNISVRPETKQRFWELANNADVAAAEDFLITLMDVYQQKK